MSYHILTSEGFGFLVLFSDIRSQNRHYICRYFDRDDVHCPSIVYSSERGKGAKMLNLLVLSVQRTLPDLNAAQADP